jgi:dTMP kinase
MRGILITVEGIDGAGKTLQVNRLGQYLRSRGHVVLITYEPGATPLGGVLREILLDHRFKDMTAPAELFLYAADRAEHVAKVLRPALEQGLTVICDRFSDSTLVYQGYVRGIEPSVLAAVNYLATEGLEPDLTVVLDIPAEEAYQRLRNAGRKADRLEALGVDFLEELRRGYLALARERAHRVVVVDALGSPEAVFERLKLAVERRLGQKG